MKSPVPSSKDDDHTGRGVEPGIADTHLVRQGQVIALPYIDILHKSRCSERVSTTDQVQM